MRYWQSKFSSNLRVSQQELLEVSTEISRKYSPEIVPEFPELVLLPVDPFHLYAYWNIEKAGEQTIMDHDSLILRIYWQSDISKKFMEKKQWLDFAVNSYPHRKKLPVPYENTLYSGVIGKPQAQKGFLACAYSNLVHTPRSGLDTRESNGREALVENIGGQKNHRTYSYTKTGFNLNGFVDEENKVIERHGMVRLFNYETTNSSDVKFDKNASGQGFG